MKKLIFLVIFIPCTIILNNVINLMISSNFADYVYTKEFPYQWVTKLSVSPKIILVGSCTTRRAYSSKALQEALGLQDGEVINLATTPNNPEITYFLVNKYINSFASNALILYGIDPFILSEIYYKNFNILLSQWSLKERFDYVAANNSDFPTTMNIVDGGNVFMNIKEIVMNNNTDTKLNDFGSTIPSKVAESDQPPLNQWFYLSTYNISQRFMENVSKLDKLVYQKHRKMIVYYPVYPDCYMKQYEKINCHNSIQAQLHKAIQLNRFDDQLSTYPDSCYVDLVHISQKARNDFLASIIDVIKRSGFQVTTK